MTTASNFSIGLGNIPAPAGNVAMNPANLALATVGNGMSAKQAIVVFGQRIQRVAARLAIAGSLRDGDIIIVAFVEVQP